MTKRSLGIVIYSDGSQAEVLYVSCHPMHGSELVFRPLAKPRKLTLAPFYLLVSVLWLLSGLMSGCLHLQVRGTKPFCLTDYKTDIKHCNYDTWKACKADLRDASICGRR